MCSKSARNGLREPETRQRHFQCYLLRTLFFRPRGTYTALQDRPSLHPGQPIFIMRHSEITVLCSRSFISVIRLYCNICVINMGISDTNASARTCIPPIPQFPSSFIDALTLAFSSKTLTESNESLSLVSSPCTRPVSVLLRVTRNKITMAAAPMSMAAKPPTTTPTIWPGERRRGLLFAGLSIQNLFVKLAYPTPGDSLPLSQRLYELLKAGESVSRNTNNNNLVG